jgi:hypothetical protein
MILLIYKLTIIYFKNSNMKKLTLLTVLLTSLVGITNAQVKDSTIKEQTRNHFLFISPSNIALGYIGLNYEYVFAKHFAVNTGVGCLFPKRKGVTGLAMEASVKYYLKKAPNGFYINAGYRHVSATQYSNYRYVSTDSVAGVNSYLESGIADINKQYTISMNTMIIGFGFQDTFGIHNQWVLDFGTYLNFNGPDSNGYQSDFVYNNEQLPSGAYARRYYTSPKTTFSKTPLGSQYNAKLSIGYRF